MFHRPHFTPLIPARLTDPSRLRYPLYLSPTVDGVRCSIHPELGPVSRNGNEVQNRRLKQQFADARLHGFDGEIAVGPPNVPEVLAKTIAAAMVLGTKPVDFVFFVSDDFTDPRLPFSLRIKFAQARVEALAVSWVEVLPHRLVKDAPAMFRTYEQFLTYGFAGGVLRDPNGRYRCGRATEASGLAITIEPAEAVTRHREIVLARQRRTAKLH